MPTHNHAYRYLYMYIKRGPYRTTVIIMPKFDCRQEVTFTVCFFAAKCGQTLHTVLLNKRTQYCTAYNSFHDLYTTLVMHTIKKKNRRGGTKRVKIIKTRQISKLYMESTAKIFDFLLSISNSVPGPAQA